MCLLCCLWRLAFLTLKLQARRVLLLRVLLWCAMPELDINALMSAGVGGGGVWLAIKTELKFLWRTVDELKTEIKELKKKAA